MTIGLTGARGIIGRRFAEIAAASGAVVSAFGGDIRDAEAVRHWVATERPDRIVHCAARVEVPGAEADPQAAFAVNVGGTLNLLGALDSLESPVWFFYASSSHVYADAGVPIDEGHRIEPRNVYALTKSLGEQTALYYAKRPWMTLCIGRIFSIYDPEQTGSYLYPATAARIAAKADAAALPIREGLAVRDFSAAAAIAAAIHGLMQRQASGTVNIGSGTGRTIVEQLALWFGDRCTFEAAGPPSHSAIVADIGKLRGLLG